MAKRNFGSSKQRVSTNKNTNADADTNNGGILGSGIFGHFGSIVQCDANDKSMFCTLTKFVSTIMMLLFLAVLAYLIYYVFKIFILSGSGSSIGSKITKLTR
jgi:hypothetical protein